MERTDRGSDRGNDITPADGTQTQSGRRAQTSIAPRGAKAADVFRIL